MTTPQGINRRTEINLTPSLVNRLNERIAKGKPTDCWPWQGAMRNGYGAIRHEGKVLQSHRVAYVLAHGEHEDGKVMGHTCDNRACCNPNHLEAITPGQNNRDARGRLKFHLVKGEDAPGAVLNNELVRTIWTMKLEGKYPAAIARELGLNCSTVQGVCCGRTWRCVTDELPQLPAKSKA